MAKKQYVFVDIDGVLNTFKLRQDGFESSGLGFPLKLSKTQADWLIKLTEDTNSELMWCSSWQHEANEHVGIKIGLPKMPHLILTQVKVSESLGSIKARAIKNYVKEDKFVVFDDEYDLGYYLKDTTGIHIFIHSDYGLSEGDIEVARNYLN